jgi:translation initiation factor 1
MAIGKDCTMDERLGGLLEQHLHTFESQLTVQQTPSRRPTKTQAKQRSRSNPTSTSASNVRTESLTLSRLGFVRALAYASLGPARLRSSPTRASRYFQPNLHSELQAFVWTVKLTFIRAERNGRKTLTTVQGIPTKFDQKKILKVIKKKFACNGTIVNDEKMGEVIQLQGDQRKDVEKFLVDKDEGLDIDAKTIKVHGF